MLAAALLAVLTAVPASHTALAPAHMNLLALDQGTVMLESPPSFGEGVLDWSPLAVVDGTATRGWCTAQGAPVGGAFLFDLETDSRLETLRVRNAGAQEADYPGISVKTLELWGAGANGPFKKIAAFEAPRGADKDFPVPAAAPVRRVKLVVAANHGNPSFTEIMELELIGTKVGISPTVDMSGDYHSDEWNGLRMEQRGTHLEGCYDYEGGVFSGEVKGRVARITWREVAEDGSESERGTATFVVAPDRSWVRGRYEVEGQVTGTWDLRPAGPGQKPKCTIGGGR